VAAQNRRDGAGDDRESTSLRHALSGEDTKNTKKGKELR